MKGFWKIWVGACSQELHLHECLLDDHGEGANSVVLLVHECSAQFWDSGRDPSKGTSLVCSVCRGGSGKKRVYKDCIWDLQDRGSAADSARYSPNPNYGIMERLPRWTMRTSYVQNSWQPPLSLGFQIVQSRRYLCTVGPPGRYCLHTWSPRICPPLQPQHSCTARSWMSESNLPWVS